jgi:hypothetical protein
LFSNLNASDAEGEKPLASAASTSGGACGTRQRMRGSVVHAIGGGVGIGRGVIAALANACGATEADATIHVLVDGAPRCGERLVRWSIGNR